MVKTVNEEVDEAFEFRKNRYPNHERILVDS